jgi:preprotein translocase subunit SecA
VVEEKNHHVDLTEKGREVFAREERDFFVLPDLAESAGAIQNDESLTPIEKAQRLAAIEQAYALKNELISNADQLLRAYSSTRRTSSTSCRTARSIIVDRDTGRLMVGPPVGATACTRPSRPRKAWSIERETQTLATITVQNYFRKYQKLAGMTGTAETEAAEFHGIYKLDVVIIPSNRPIARKDLDDVIYKTKKAKYKAIVEEIKRLHRLGLPVLVGTTTVEVSELLSRLLKLQGINHNVLNAKHHKMEAEIVSEAGRIGAMTIATNMAGRGTDIKLAPGVLDLPSKWPSDPDLKKEEWEGQATGCRSSAPNATRAGASTGSCAAAPAARATRARPSSSCRSRTTSCAVQPRAHHQGDGQAGRPGRRGHHALDGHAGDREGADARREPELRHPQAPARV